jgi:molybdenum-dependent DNA-binding transcriptional regulator ModE
MDTQLAQFATVRQLEYLSAIEQHGSQRKAAKALGINQRTLEKSLQGLRARAAQKSASQHQDVNHIPDGFAITGTSTLTKTGDGLQWVKTAADKQQQEAMLRQFAETLADEVKGLAKPIAPPKAVAEDLLCVIPIGDPHFGLKVWMHEGGGNFDLEIAERLTCGAIDRLVSSAPPARTAVLLNLGDHFHADSQSNTTTEGTRVDVDGRWAKIQQVGLRAMLYCIQRLLERHERVIVRINRGNHDKHAAYALSLMISCYFHNEPRVEVDLSPAAVWYFQFGNVLLASTHGDTIKGDKLMGVMAADRPKEWGDTKHRYWFVGHIHHHDSKEYPGGIVEYLRTLAPGDAWHHGQGYRSGRDMRLVVMHKEHGEIERHRVDVGMLQ